MHRRMTLLDWTMVATMVLGVGVLLGKGQIHLLGERLSIGVSPFVGGRGIGRGGMLLASSAFVVVALRSLGRERSLLALLLCIGLVLCWIGDVVGYQGHFVPSAASFLVGHLFFAAGFMATGLNWQRLGLAAAAVVIASSLLALWFLPHVPSSQKLLILGYIAVISLMVVGAWSAEHPNFRLLAMAACLFYISDIAVAYWKFVPHSGNCAFLCYPLYYPACMLLALGPRLRLN